MKLVPDHFYPDAFWLQDDDGQTNQSYVDLRDPLHLELNYTKKVAAVINTLPEPFAVIHVGGAGMTMARWMRAKFEDSFQVVFEPDEEMLDLVETRLPYPVGISVFPWDGKTGIDRTTDHYADLILLDAFIGEQVPDELVTEEFFADCKRVLHKDGTVIMNIIDNAPFNGASAACERLPFDHKLILSSPAVLRRRQRGNILLVGSDRPLDVDAIQEGIEKPPYPYRLLTDRITRGRVKA